MTYYHTISRLLKLCVFKFNYGRAGDLSA
uniref:Uncharacterized protein n=1 Tax=Anguilla anguilla TaxID=7936 RepID=A0A0E9TV77_ANGAN